MLTETTKNYDDTKKLVNDVIKCINKYKINNDDCLVRFTIEVINKNDEDEEDEPVKKKRKR